MEEIYGEDLPEGSEGILDVEMEEVMGLADKWREVVKAGINIELGSSGSSLEEDEKEEGRKVSWMQRVVRHSISSSPSCK